MKSISNQICRANALALCLISMFNLCSCTTMQNAIQASQAQSAKKAKLTEFYRNREESWSSGNATNGTVTCKEFLEILSSLSQPVQETLSKYGHPDFVHLIEDSRDSANVGLGDLITVMPFYKVALLYHSKTNIIVFIRQQTGETKQENYKSQEDNVINRMERNPPGFDITAMRKESDYNLHFEGPGGAWSLWGPSKLVDIYYQRKLDNDKRKEEERIRQEEKEKMIAAELEIQRRKSLPVDQEVKNLVIGYWDYEDKEETVSERAVIEYKSNQTFNVKGKVSALGQTTPVVYSGTWDVKDGKIVSIVKSVAVAGKIRVMTPLGPLPQACIKEGEEEEDIIQSIGIKRIEMVKGKDAKDNKVLSRLENKPLDITKPDGQRVNVLKEKAKKVKDGTLVFKAFYVGMPIEDAAELAAYYLDGISESSRNMSIETITNGKWLRDNDSGFRVVADEAGNVTAFYFPKKVVDSLFESKAVEVKSFIKTFQGAYSVGDFMYAGGSLEVFSNNSMVGKTVGVEPIALKLGMQDKWTATPKNGISVTVYGDPTVFEENKLRELTWEGAAERIPSGSLLVRKINTAAFD